MSEVLKSVNFLKKVKIIRKKFGGFGEKPYLCIVLGERLTRQTKFSQTKKNQQKMQTKFTTEQIETAKQSVQECITRQKYLLENVKIGTKEEVTTTAIPDFWFLCGPNDLTRTARETGWERYGSATEYTHVEYDSDEDYLRTSCAHIPNFSNVSKVKPDLLKAIYGLYLEYSEA